MAGWRAIVVAGLVLAVMLPVSLAAQEQAYTKAISGRLVHLEIQLPGGRTIRGSAEEGSLFRIERHEDGLILGFAPRLGVAEGEVAVRVYQIRRRASGDESIHLLEEQQLVQGVPAFPRLAPELAVQVVKTEPGSESAAASSCSRAAGSAKPEGFGAKAAGRCCVTCGGWTSCGCAVEDSCGSCCAGACCAV